MPKKSGHKGLAKWCKLPIDNDYFFNLEINKSPLSFPVTVPLVGRSMHPKTKLSHRNYGTIQPNSSNWIHKFSII